jgi:sigma-B regulation protein RsbU (phosphoserine phosphatase)
MRLRNKLFIILVLLAILPLIAAGLLTRLNLESCSVDVAGDTRASVEQIVEVARDRFVNQYAATFDRDRILLESTISKTADTLEQIYLIEKISPSSIEAPGLAYFATDYDDDLLRPDGMVYDDRQYIQNDDGSKTPILISKDHPVFVIPISQQNQSTIANDVRLLAGLTEDLISGSTLPTNEPWLLSHYTGLADSGSFISFPGKGNYPENYDPRNRPWFEAAINSDTDVKWIGPIIDAPTGQVRMTCATTARHPDGSVIGVVAADILMLDMLDEIQLPDNMAGQVEIMLATLDDSGALIHAKADYADMGGRSNAPIKLDYITSDHAAQTQQLVALMQSANKGTLDFVMDGRVWILSFQRLINQDSFVVVAITRDTIDAVANNVQDEVSDVFTQTLSSNAMIGVSVVGIAIVVAFFGARSVTKPILTLADTATAIAEGNLDATASVKTGDELETLATAFNNMVPKLRDRLVVRESLQLASEVQQNLLPSAPPAIPGLDLAARSVYCDETGGDYFDFFELEEIAAGKHAIVVGDVTGHGIAAALLMTTARALLHSRASDSDQIAEVIGKVNANLSRDARPGQFMTLYYLMIEPEARRACWVSAGHDAAIIYDPSNDSFNEFVGEDIPLGIEANWKFHEFHADLPIAGSVAVIGTDGIWEARNSDGDMFGKDRLRETIKANAESTADDIAQAILDDVIRFRAGSPQTDDITLVVFKVVA